MMSASHSSNQCARKNCGGTTFIPLVAINRLHASALKKPATG